MQLHRGRGPDGTEIWSSERVALRPRRTGVPFQNHIICNIQQGKMPLDGRVLQVTEMRRWLLLPHRIWGSRELQARAAGRFGGNQVEL